MILEQAEKTGIMIVQVLVYLALLPFIVIAGGLAKKNYKKGKRSWLLRAHAIYIITYISIYMY